jgi:DNA invertase Pin-like site-specific DNA recombinase
MDAYGYVRVSSKTQSHMTQQDAIERAAAARGDVIVGWYAEKRSGRNLARPELDRVRDAVRTGEVRRLYVFKIDRLTRSGVADTYKVVDEIRRAGCELHVPGDNLVIKPEGSDDIVSECILFGLALGARVQRQAINDNIAAARERLEAAGRPWGRPARLSFAQRSEVMARRDAGESIREIAQAMKVPRATVGRVASRNPPLLQVPRTARAGRVEGGASRSCASETAIEAARWPKTVTPEL